jgi:hypothetical protein
VTAWFRVTVEDLETGEKMVREVAEGDFVLMGFGSCYLANRTHYANGTVQLTVRDHWPAAASRPIEPGEVAA